MPRRNKRKTYTARKTAVFCDDTENHACKPECAGCAFAGYGGVCITSDGTCLKTIPVRREENAVSQLQADLANHQTHNPGTTQR